MRRVRFNCPVELQGPGSPRIFLILLKAPTAHACLKVFHTPGIPALGAENGDVPGLFCVNRESEALGDGLYRVTATYGPKPAVPEDRSPEPVASAPPGSDS